MAETRVIKPWTDKRWFFGCGFGREPAFINWWRAHVRIFAVVITVSYHPRWIRVKEFSAAATPAGKPLEETK